MASKVIVLLILTIFAVCSAINFTYPKIEEILDGKRINTNDPIVRNFVEEGWKEIVEMGRDTRPENERKGIPKYHVWQHPRILKQRSRELYFIMMVFFTHDNGSNLYCTMLAETKPKEQFSIDCYHGAIDKPSTPEENVKFMMYEKYRKAINQRNWLKK